MRASEHFDELPILAELESQVERAARRRLEGADVAAAPRRRRPRPPARFVRRLRVPRRVTVLASLVFLVAATATAAVTILPGEDPAPSRAATLLEGSGDGALRSLQVHELDGKLCPTLILAETVDTACVTVPTGYEGAVRTTASGLTRFVFGLTGERARTISLRQQGGERQAVPTRPLPRSVESGTAARGTRYFLARLPLRSNMDGERLRVRVFAEPVPQGGRASAGCTLESLRDAGCRAR